MFIFGMIFLIISIDDTVVYAYAKFELSILHR